MGVEEVMKFVVEKRKEALIAMENFDRDAFVWCNNKMGVKEEVMKFVVEKGKEALIAMENFGGDVFAWFKKIFLPETRVDKIHHRLHVAQPFLITARILTVIVCFCKRDDGGGGGSGKMPRHIFGDNPKRNGVGLASVQSCLIINVRESLKETDEYKRAVEEEWASRQQALQIQAEEAQRQRRLHKRRKAESQRRLDMERRQKERLDEIRNTQKEDEKNMRSKEVIRAEVRKDLKKLEVSCRNMASLLHCLGVRVGGWPNPLLQEVQIAYKKALLTFHPDKASRTDIRQQVEAEEKFKLINSMEKIFPLQI